MNKRIRFLTAAAAIAELANRPDTRAATDPRALCRRAGLQPPRREVCCAAHERHKLEHLCRYSRYITRPAMANERLTLNRAGDVVLQLKSPYHDGTTHVVMSPLELMQRLAALVPRPRLHLIRFHGVLAPNAKLHSAIIPSAPVNAPNAAAVHVDAPHPSAPVRLSFAQLLKRVFDIDIEQCPSAAAPLKIIAAIEHPPLTPISSPISICPPEHRPDRPCGD